MHERVIQVKNKKGENVEAVLMVPDQIQEMVGLFGQKFVLETMIQAYVQREKRRLISGWKPREKVLKIKESSLSAEQKQTLITIGLLAAD